MKNKLAFKFVFIAILSCVLVFNFCGFVIAEESQDLIFDGIRYSINNNEVKISEIIEGTVLPDDFIIPELITDASGKVYIVTSIAEHFSIYMHENVTSITIPKSVNHLYSSSFSSPYLKYIYVDENNPSFCSKDGVLFDKEIKTIVKFPSGRKETEYDIPMGITIIGTSAFCGCDSLTKIVIPDTVKKIYRNAFANCSGLISLNFPETVEYINAGVFQGCTNLKNLQIPDSIESINTDYLFAECSSLSSFVFPKNVNSIGWGMFANCTSLKEVQFNNQINFLGGEAFKNCTSLSEIVIPQGIKEIGMQCFDGCTSLKSITIPNSVEIYGENCFKNVSSDCIYNVPMETDVEALADLLNINKNQINLYLSTDSSNIQTTLSVASSNSISDNYSQTKTSSSNNNKYVIIIIATVLIAVAIGAVIKKRR